MFVGGGVHVGGTNMFSTLFCQKYAYAIMHPPLSLVYPIHLPPIQ